jgi:hypothetical protein
MAKSQRLKKNVTKINDNFIYVEYTYLYVDEKEEVEKEKGDFKGFHPIGKTIHQNIKVQGKNLVWIWGQMYQKN